MVVWTTLMVAALLRAQPRCPAAPADPAPPFLNLRQATLGYHGPAEDLSGLNEYRLGWFGPTNLADSFAGDLWWAANLAVREANSPLPTPHSPLPPPPFRLVPRWAENPWGTGVSQLTRMVYEERPIAILGSVDSATTHLAEQVVAKAQLPLVSPIATDKSVTLAGVPWMFACAPSDAAIARVLVDAILVALAVTEARESEISNLKSQISPTSVPPALAEKTNRSRLALLTVTDHESRMTAREVLREFSRRQRPPDFRFELQPGAPDVARHLAALAEARPAAILVVAGAEEGARLVRAVREVLPASDLKDRSDARDRHRRGPVLFGSHSMARTRFRELAGAAGEGVRFPVLSVENAADSARSRFTASFEAERHRLPDDTALLTYDATRLLLEAVRRAGPNRARVRTALAALSPWQGIAGAISFDGTGQNTRTNVQMAILRSGRIVRLQRIHRDRPRGPRYPPSACLPKPRRRQGHPRPIGWGEGGGEGALSSMPPTHQ